jgi:hypothetical protein
MMADMWQAYTRLSTEFSLNQDLHHDVSHTPFTSYNGRPAWQYMCDLQKTYYPNFVAHLLNGLSTGTDPSNGRSYLYNSLVYVTCEAGQTHGQASHPVILAGNAGGSLTSGNYIDYANATLESGGTQRRAWSGADSFSDSAGSSTFSNNWIGVPYNRLMVTILQAMGITPAEYEDETLNTQMRSRNDVGTQNRGLTSFGGWGYVTTQDLARDNWNVNHSRSIIQNYDLRFFRDKLPMPT